MEVLGRGEGPGAVAVVRDRAVGRVCGHGIDAQRVAIHVGGVFKKPGQGEGDGDVQTCAPEVHIRSHGSIVYGKHVEGGRGRGHAAIAVGDGEGDGQVVAVEVGLGREGPCAVSIVDDAADGRVHGHGRNIEQIAVHVVGTGQKLCQRDGQGPVFLDLAEIHVSGCGGVVDGQDVDDGPACGGTPVIGGHCEGDGQSVAVQICRRGEGPGAAWVADDAADGRVHADGRDAQVAAVLIVAVGQKLRCGDGQGAVFLDLAEIHIPGFERVAHGQDADGGRGRGRCAVPIGHGECQGDVLAMKILGRGEGPGAVAVVPDGAECRVNGHGRHVEAVAVHVVRAGQEQLLRKGQGVVFEDGSKVDVFGRWGVVHGADVQEGRAPGPAAPAVGQDEGDAHVFLVDVGGRGEGPGAVAVVGDGAAGLVHGDGSGRDAERVAVGVAAGESEAGLGDEHGRVLGGGAQVGRGEYGCSVAARGHDFQTGRARGAGIAVADLEGDFRPAREAVGRGEDPEIVAQALQAALLRRHLGRDDAQIVPVGVSGGAEQVVGGEDAPASGRALAQVHVPRHGCVIDRQDFGEDAAGQFASLGVGRPEGNGRGAVVVGGRQEGPRPVAVVRDVAEPARDPHAAGDDRVPGWNRGVRRKVRDGERQAHVFAGDGKSGRRQGPGRVPPVCRGLGDECVRCHSADASMRDELGAGKTFPRACLCRGLPAPGPAMRGAWPGPVRRREML